MEEPDPSPTPAHLFLEYWRKSAVLTASQRSSAPKVSSDFHHSALDMVHLEDPALAVAALRALVACSEAGEVGAQLGAMRAIDEAFGAIHPRTPRPPSERATKLPPWMEGLRDSRVLQGKYCQAGELALVPRGPLLRVARHPHASSADSLADRFSYLSGVSLELSHEGTPIAIELSHVGMGMFDGVIPIERPGSERIAFVPLAELGEDLDVRAVEISGQKFAAYGPAACLDAKNRLIAAIDAVKESELVIAPELVMSADHSDAVCASLRECEEAPKLLLLGTENTHDTENGQPFNEAVIVNSVGSVIWRQRKIWPASISAEDGHVLGLCDAAASSRMPENNASGCALNVVDIDGFGRIIVLICQDLQLDISSDAVVQFQPDWVLVPILDSNLAVGRWAHRRAVNLSEKAQSRFLAVTSSALAYRYGHLDADTAPIGMAIGPMQTEEDDDVDRAAAFVTPINLHSPRYGVIQWRSAEGWTTSKLTLG
ncbi:hypothetical protein [Novosphingobium aquae]|uniref:CN hydrolase domain-containing protein n=1 Tax=Novosphingobium aquae TaxID=3133435 RepID=A0ABU8SB30_9SPHN